MNDDEDWTLKEYDLSENQSLYVVADPEDQDYKLGYEQSGRQQVVGEGYSHPEDAEQVAVFMLDDLDVYDSCEEVLSP